MLICRSRGHCFLNFAFNEDKITHSWLVERRKYLLLIGRARDSYIELVSLFCATTTTSSFRFFGVRLFSRIVHSKNTWKSSAKAKRELLKVHGLSFLTRNSKRLFVSKAKMVIRFAWLKNWNNSWSRPWHVLLPRYGFFQQTITE